MQSMKRLVSVWLVAATVLSIAPMALAQDRGGRGSGPLGDELQDYWAERRGVEVISRRLYEKVGRHQLSLYGSVIPNDPFLNYYPIGLRYDYYLLESIALEIDGSYIGDTFRSDSDLETFLGGEGVNVDLLDQQRWRAHFGVNWSPFYGKIAFLNQKLIHFDFNLFGGIGVVNVRSLTADRTREEDEYKVEGSLGAGFNIWLSQMFSIRIDYRQFIFEKAGGGVSNPSEISLGFSVFL
jgi:outer membrane beta-barrel protein